VFAAGPDLNSPVIFGWLVVPRLLLFSLPEGLFFCGHNFSRALNTERSCLWFCVTRKSTKDPVDGVEKCQDSGSLIITTESCPVNYLLARGPDTPQYHAPSDSVVEKGGCREGRVPDVGCRTHCQFGLSEDLPGERPAIRVLIHGFLEKSFSVQVCRHVFWGPKNLRQKVSSGTVHFEWAFWVDQSCHLLEGVCCFMPPSDVSLLSGSMYTLTAPT